MASASVSPGIETSVAVARRFRSSPPRPSDGRLQCAAATPACTPFQPEGRIDPPAGGGVGAALSWQVRRSGRRQTVGFIYRNGFAIRREILILGPPPPHCVQGLGLGIDDAKLERWSLVILRQSKFKALQPGGGEETLSSTRALSLRQSDTRFASTRSFKISPLPLPKSSRYWALLGPIGS